MITIKKETSLDEFEFWGGAYSVSQALTYAQLNEIEDWINDLYPDGIDETTLNDLFWFDTDEIANVLGFDDFDALIEANKDDEDED